MIFGRIQCKTSEHGRLEMKEVTLVLSPEILRELGQFFLQVSEQIEDGEFNASTHWHISSYSQAWGLRYPNEELIIAPEIEVV